MNKIIFASSRGGKTTSIFNLFKDKRFKILDRILPQHIYIISPTLDIDKT